MEPTENERHIAELRQTLRELVAEAEIRVSNLEAELIEARAVVQRMRKAVEEASRPF